MIGTRVFAEDGRQRVEAAREERLVGVDLGWIWVGLLWALTNRENFLNKSILLLLVLDGLFFVFFFFQISTTLGQVFASGHDFLHSLLCILTCSLKLVV